MKALVLLAVTALGAASVSADVFTWNGNASKNWTGLNWNQGTPNNDGTDEIHMAGSNRLSNRANGGWDINSLIFDSGAGSFILSGFSADEILLESGGIANNSAALQTINHPILLNANQSWNASAGNLSVGGTVNLFEFSLTTPGAKDVSIGGIVSGTGGLVKSGTGALTLAGNNSFAGGINASGGRLIAANNLAFGGGSVALSGGAKLEGAASSRTIANNVSVSGSAKVGGATDVTLTTTVSGSGTLVKEDANTVTLQAANSFSGAVQVNGGTLVAGGLNALGAVSSIAVNGGALKLANTGGNAVANAATLTLNSSSLILNNQTETLGTLNVIGICSLTLSADILNGNLTFANLNITEGQMLQISNWGFNYLPSGDVESNDDRLFAMADPGISMLARIMFDGFEQGARWSGTTGEITPIPEPNVMVTVLCGLLCLVLYRRRN